MFNPFKKLFGRRSDAVVEEVAEFDTASVITASPAARTPLPRTVRVAQALPLSPNAPTTLGLPLKTILARLPAELMQRVRMQDVGEAEIFIPMQKVLAQIGTGAVRLSFGELRQIAPPGTFAAENDRDRTLVELPLSEVLARINPGLLARRSSQRQVQVPPEVTGPFGGQTRVQISTTPLKPAPAAPAQQASRPPTTVIPQAPTPAPARVAPVARPAAQPAPVYQQPAAPAQPAFRSQPAAPIQTPAPARIPLAAPQFQTPAVQPAAQSAVQPISARIRPIQPLPQQSAAPVQPAPIPQRAPQPPAQWNEQPVFNRAYSPTPSAPSAHAAPTAPVFTPITPIAPEPVRGRSGDTEVIPNSFDNSASFGNVPEFSAPPSAPIAPVEPITPIAFEPVPLAPAPAVAPAPAPDKFMDALAGETRFLNVSLSDLSLSWPESVRQEIHALHLTHAHVGLPMGAVEGVIKSGKIAFPWKAVRSWIKPPLPPSTSQFDTTILELPLKVVTPLFLAEIRAFKPQRKVAIDATIPNLFSGGSTPAESAIAAFAPPVAAPAPPPQQSLPVLPTPSAAAPTAPPAPLITPSHAPAPAPEPSRGPDTNYYVWKDDNDTPEEAPVFSKKGESPGTAFLNRFATPNEIVTKAASLGGVDGALIALPDGLLVASRIPASMNADTIAAFLPSIFGRVSQCTRELRLGDLNNLNFTVGNIPWKIFRVGAIYFAVFGRPGEALPTAQLVGLVAELDRKGK